MGLPRTVQRQLEEAEALAAAQMTPAEPTPGPNVVTDVSQIGAQPAPAPAPAAPPAPAPAPAAPAPAPDDVEHKYRTLQGMFRAEQDQKRALAAQLQQMQQQIDALTAKTTAPAPKAPEIEADPNDKRLFGDDTVEMVNKYVRQALTVFEGRMGSLAQNLDARLKALEGQVTGVSQRTELSIEEQFKATLRQLVPDWEQVNRDPEWLRWLAEEDPVYGVTRQAALDQAAADRSAPRVAAVFKAFKDTRPAPKAPDSAASLVVPSEGGGGAVTPPAPQPKQIVTQKAIQTFYNDVAKGRYRGREAEQQRIEAEINLAVFEGRVV